MSAFERTINILYLEMVVVDHIISGAVVVFSGVKAVASNEDITVRHGDSGDPVILDHLLDLADSVEGTPALDDNTSFADNPPAKCAPLIALD